MSDLENKNKTKFNFDPNTAKPTDTPLVAKADGFNFDPSTAKEEKKGVLGHLKDTGASLMSGLAGAAEATTVGLADLYTEGRVGKDIDKTGYYKLGEAQKHWSDQKTEIAKEQEKTRQNTDGIWNKTKYVLENPSQITNAVAESLPYMLGGAALGRASKIANPIVAGAVGEGAVMAGSQAESIRQQSDDQLLNNGQEAVAAGTGVLGGLFGYAGGRLAQKLGIGDVDTMLMTGRVGSAEIAGEIASMPAKSLPRRVVEGAISEGFLEELPQSVSEQILQNLALDKPWHDGVEDAAVMGTLAGMAMGAGGNIMPGNKAENTSATTEPSLNSSYLPTVSTSPDSFTGEYIPRADVQDKAPQAQSAFVYDQQSTDADNRLNFNIPPNPDVPRSGFDDPINPNTPPTPNGHYFDAPQLPSQKMGLNPNDGPMSSAAALAVDSGVSSAPQLGYTEQQDQQQNTTNNTVPVDFQAQHESKVKDLYAQGVGENVTLKNGEQVRLIQTVDEANGEGAYNLNAVNQDGEIVGSLGYFTVEDENGNRFNPQLHVDEQHRRNGIATAMYDYAEANGAKIPELDATAGALRTEQGQAFREARNARQNGIELKQKDVPEFNIEQKLENIDHSIDWHKENIELATNEYNKKRSQDAIKELQEERHELVQKKDANLILGADGQNKWFGSQTKADAFIAKKELSNTHHVVQTENKRFEIQPIITEIQDHNLAANTSNQKDFQMEALDHGVLNVPLSKRGDIDQQIDQYKKEQAVIEKDQRDVRKIDHQKAQTVAKSLFNHLSKQHIQYYADRANITVNAATKELKSMAHWQPNKAIKIYNALKEVQQKSPSELSVPSEITDLEQQFNAIKGNSVKQAIEKSKIKKQIDQLKSKHTEITTTPFGSEQIQKQYGDTAESVMSDIEILGDDFTIDLRDNNKKTNALNNPNYNAVQKADGSVEIVGMKHPSTGEWIGQEPASQQDLQDSAENIRAEKIRQKDIADMHNSVYGLATDEQLQESLKHLNKEIKKAQKQSENEVVNGKRSTRKAVASGALDRFLKNRVDLETYIKARKNGELKQRNKKIDDYSRDKLKPDHERRGASPLDTTFTPLSVVSATRRVLSILEHLKIVTTQVDTSVRGRIVVGWQRIGVNKVKGLDSHSFTVQVVESFDGLPSAIQEDNRYQGENGETKRYDVLGVWHNGTLYINAGDIQGNNSTQQTTFEMYEELILHEVVGHFGVQQIFGREYKTKLQQLFNALGGLEGIRKIAKDNGVDMQQFNDVYINPRMQAVKDEIYTESDVQQSLVGELFAFVAQNAKSKPFVRQKLKEVIGYIRQWFRDRGFDQFLSRYNDADLMMFLAEARKAVVDQKYFGKYKDQKITNNKNDSNEPLYSRQSKSNSGSTTQQVRNVLVGRFGKDTIYELERQGKLEIIQDYSVEGVEGFYHNGKAVLVASNLTAESTVATFLHELGGHAGFQNMMNQKQYQELMSQFDKLVEQGNPVAMAAKVLAEREQGSERQQLEYLPYLLTLSSTMQQRNVIQRNALQKLINNIVSFVKAWVFDQFGINLNLNPDDMLALSERMIQKNSAAIQSKEQQNPSAVFSEKTKSVFTDVFTIAKDEQQRIAKEIDDLLSTLKSLPDPVKMKMPPVLLALDGVNGLSVQDLPLHLDRQTIRKMMGRVDGKQDAGHQLTLGQVKQLINEITNPVMVFKDRANGVVVITEMKDQQGNPILSAIHLNKKWRGYEINDIATAFSKDNNPYHWFNKNQTNIVYLNQEKSQELARSSSHQLRGAVQNILASNQSVLSPEGVVNFVEQSNSSLYSRQSPQKMMDDLAQNIKNMSVKSIKDKTGYKFTDWLGIGLSALGRRQLTEIYSKLLPQLNKYNELAAQMDADKNDAGAEADGIVREWANLKDENELADLMHDATLAKIDPAQPYVPGDNRIKYQQLRQNFNALSPEAQAMYIKARDAYRKHYAKVQSAIKDRILRAALSSQKKADLIKQMDDQFYGYIKGVYFPLARFGKYVMVVRNQNGDVESVSRAETMGEAQKIRSEMLKKFPQWKVEPVIQDKAFRSARDAVGRGFMSNLFDEVANLGLSSAEQVSFEDTLNQLYLSSMPDLSWAKHGIHRKGTAGFSQDARRAFAQNMFSGANYLAKLRYGDQLADQLDAMQKHADDQIKQNHQYNQSTAQSVIDEMNKRHENLMNPKGHPLSSALTSLGFIYYLGLSPAAAMVNLSQTALVAYPLMGAKWDFDKAGKELLKASNDFRKGLEFHKVKWQGTKTDLYKAVSSDISKFLNKDEQAAYQKAVDSGVIDVTQAHDLAGIAQGEDSGVMWKTRPIMRAASVMFHSAERFNREVTFIAAYRLARQSGAHHDLAFDQAVDVTYKGHFDYSSGNRPRIMQGNVAKVLLLFKQFGQNMLYTLARQTYQSIKGETDADKKEARRAISAILAMHATFAGALGLPGVWFIMAIASAWGGDDDEPWDAEVALRNYLAEAFNPTISNLLMKGAPRGVGIDVSSRVGINNLLLPDVQEGLEGKRWAESAMAGALGPVAGMSTNLIQGSQEISEGHNLRGVETMLPVFLKNFAKTYRYADEGVQDKTGISIMDEVSSMDLLVQSMGFSPSDVRTANEGKSAIYQFNRKLNERRSRLMTLWSRAKMMDDQQEMDEVWKEIQGFNDKNPSRRITRINLNQSYRNRQRRIDRAEDGIYLSRNRQDARAAGYFAFGE